MPTTAPEARIAVAVGVLSDKRGRMLLQQRQAGTPCAGQWEFPGGKLEVGESVEQALHRELYEELGITVRNCRSLLEICHDYAHARVRLQVLLVGAFDGEPRGREGQRVAWASYAEAAALDLLPAAWPILERVKGLSLARKGKIEAV